MRCRTWLAAFFFGCLPFAPAAAARPHPVQQTPASPIGQDTADAALVELRLGQLVTRTVLAFSAGTDVLLPVAQFFDLAGIRAVPDSGSGVSGVLQPGSVPFHLWPANRQLQVGERHLRLEPGEVRADDGDVYLSAARLGDALGVRIVVNWSDLEVVVPDPSPLPVAQARRREAARSLLVRSSTADAIESGEPLNAPGGWHGLVADYSFLAPAADPIGGGAYTVALGSDLAGGSLELGARSVGRADAGTARLDASWLGVWRGNRRLTQLRIGDGQATGPRARPVRGFAVTNAPYLRPSLIGTVPYAGSLPAGWQVEFYRGGELVAFDSAGADNRFSAELPVVYGENPIDVVAYGPSGERRTVARTFRVSSALLPAHRFEYGLSAGGCRDALCDGTANLDLRYGASRRWTVQTGLDALVQGGDGDRWHPYASVTGSLSNSWTAQMEAVGGGFVRAGLDYEPSVDLHLVGEVSRYDEGAASPLLNPGRRRFRMAASAFVRPSRVRDYFYLEGSAEHLASAGGVADRFRLGLSTQAGPVRLSPYVRVEREAGPLMLGGTRGYQGVSAFLLPRAGWGPLLRQVWVRTALEVEDASRPSLASFTAARPVTPSTRVEAGVRWGRQSGGATFTLGFSSFLRSFRSLTTLDAPANAAPSISQLVQGSVMYDRESGSVTLSSAQALQRSGVAGRVFLDGNGNGRYDLGETTLPNVRVRVGDLSGTSDSSGSYRVWDLPPFEPVRVEVDSLSFESPLWVTARAPALVLPAPNSFTAVDVPLVNGAVIEGRVVRGVTGTGQGVGGVGLVLQERRSGKRRELTSFTDGTFYLLGVPPGEYELAVSQASEGRLAARARPKRFTILPSGEGTPSDLELELVAGE